MAAMLTGHEIGIGPMQALSEISVINGRPCMSAKLMRALVHRAGHDLWFEAKGNTKVTICARRADWPEDRAAKVTWTMDDAKAAGLAGGQNYRKYPRAMLAARATGEICRDNFADVLGGIGYTPEELSDGDLVADDDLVVESRADVAPPEKATNVRKAKVAPARKTAAAKAAPAPAPSPRPWTCRRSRARTGSTASWTPRWSRTTPWTQLRSRPASTSSPRRTARTLASGGRPRASRRSSRGT